ncbi:MAG: 2-dehydro-3-deoxyphosphogluconate aldolase, partial [Mucilaginibacter sp.]|nr:2-dehydro-3-deoxyphosphogluconate aldolase [Mucilaginibacter sp.]
KQYKNAGAVGFGIGSSLVNTNKEITDQYLMQLTETAKNYVRAIAE